MRSSVLNYLFLDCLSKTAFSDILKRRSYCKEKWRKYEPMILIIRWERQWCAHPCGYAYRPSRNRSSLFLAACWAEWPEALATSSSAWRIARSSSSNGSPVSRQTSIWIICWEKFHYDLYTFTYALQKYYCGHKIAPEKYCQFYKRSFYQSSLKHQQYKACRRVSPLELCRQNERNHTFKNEQEKFFEHNK